MTSVYSADIRMKRFVRDVGKTDFFQNIKDITAFVCDVKCKLSQKMSDCSWYINWNVDACFVKELN